MNQFDAFEILAISWIVFAQEARCLPRDFRVAVSQSRAATM